MCNKEQGYYQGQYVINVDELDVELGEETEAAIKLQELADVDIWDLFSEEDFR